MSVAGYYLRLSSTCKLTTATVSTELHLLEYRQRMLEYLLYFKSGQQNRMTERNSVRPFSSPTDENGYGDSFITNDLITDLYLDFIAKGRKSESIEYAQTRTGKFVFYHLNICLRLNAVSLF